MAAGHRFSTASGPGSIEVSQDSSLLAVLAHPDDETFRCGGTLALLARRGVRVWLLCATRGEAGSCGNPPLCQPDGLGQVREAELRCACAALGIEPPRFLGYRDGTLSQVDENQAVAQIVRAVRELRPQTLLTWPPDGLSGHPDHIAVSQWTGEAFRRAADPAAYPEHQAEGWFPYAVTWLYHLVIPHSLVEVLEIPHLHPVPDEVVSLQVDISAVWEAKLAAIHCHCTQMSSSPILAAPEAKQRLFLGMEYFCLVMTRLVPAVDCAEQGDEKSGPSQYSRG